MEEDTSTVIDEIETSLRSIIFAILIDEGLPMSTSRNLATIIAEEAHRYYNRKDADVKAE